MGRVDGRERTAAGGRPGRARRSTRVDAFAPALAFASELLTIANVTSRPPMPGRTSFGHAAPRVAVVERRGSRPASCPGRSTPSPRSSRRCRTARSGGRQDDRPGDRPARLAGLLAERRRRLEPDERQDAEDHALERRLDVAVGRDEDRQRRSASSALTIRSSRDDEEDPDLDQPEDDARRGSRSGCRGRSSAPDDQPAERPRAASHSQSFEKPVSSVMNDAPKKPNDANSAAGTTGSARVNAQAISQPKNEPRPRVT